MEYFHPTILFWIIIFSLLHFIESKSIRDICESIVEVKNSDLKLTSKEDAAQPPFSMSKSINEIMQLCKYKGIGYNFEDPRCIANKITVIGKLKNNPVLQEKLKRQRRRHLCDAIAKVTYFKERLEDPTEMIIQVVLFCASLLIGIYLLAVGHFRIRTMFDERYPDPTKGWPYWIYKKMKYYVVRSAKEPAKNESLKVSKTPTVEDVAYIKADDREVELEDVIEVDDEREEMVQTATAANEYTDYWKVITNPPKPVLKGQSVKPVAKKR